MTTLEQRAIAAIDRSTPEVRRKAQWEHKIVEHWQSEWSEHEDTKWINDYRWGIYPEQRLTDIRVKRKVRNNTVYFRVAPLDDDNGKSTLDLPFARLYLFYDPAVVIFNDTFTLVATMPDHLDYKLWEEIKTLADLGTVILKLKRY